MDVFIRTCATWYPQTATLHVHGVQDTQDALKGHTQGTPKSVEYLQLYPMYICTYPTDVRPCMHIQHPYREFLSSVNHCDRLITHMQLQPAFVTSKTAPKLITSLYCTYFEDTKHRRQLNYNCSYMYKYCTVILLLGECRTLWSEHLLYSCTENFPHTCSM